MSPTRPLCVAVIGDVIPNDLSTRLQADLPAESIRVQVVGAITPDAAWRQHVSARRGAALVDELRHEVGDTDVLLIDAAVDWPEFAWSRLAWARQNSVAPSILSPLACSEPALSPFPAGTAFAGEAALLDIALCWRQPRECVDVDNVSPSCSLWPAGTDTSSPKQALAFLYVDRRDARLQGARLPRDLRDAAPENALAPVRARWQSPDPVLAGFPGFDGRRVSLHILHGWGGGAAAFVRDVALACADEHHLILQSHGDIGRKSYGESLSLSLVTPDRFVELARWPVLPVIVDTVTGHETYRLRLSAICRDYGVARVLVSSVIGHSLDALDTGLPTVVVAHDYYPVWPVLHEQFDRPELDASESALAQSLATHPHPFRTESASAWMALRQGYVARIQSGHIAMAAPSEGVCRNLRRMAPGLPPIARISHGLRPFSQTGAITARNGNPLRILVLGRLNGGKGEILLDRCLDTLTKDHEVWLVGCGKAGERWFGRRNVHVLLDYQRDDLPALLASIHPDLALMPVSVSESFSFTLSELWALGIVPVASRLGSLAERIEHGVTGWLFEPDVSPLLAAIDTLHRQPDLLIAMREQIGMLTPKALHDMRAEYDALFARTGTRTDRPAEAIPRPLADEWHSLAARTLRAEYLATDWQRQTQTQSRELSARAEWGFELDRKLGSARQEVAELRQHRDVLQHTVAERTQWAEAADAETSRLVALLQQEQADHAIDNERWLQEVDRLRGEESRLDTELRSLHQSTSWRLTAPIRFVVRRMRTARTRLAYLGQRVSGNVRRLFGYWQRHGASATIERARQEFGNGEAAPLPILDAEPMHVDVSDLRFADATATPRASIIIPVYNKFSYTAACLASLAKEGADCSFEVIVVDDGSSDETESSLRALSGIRYHRNPVNLGFVGACNAGASIALGEYLVFLNNDTVVRPRWLDTLLDTFVQHERVGLVGAKLVYPDGRLQEAGGVIFSDGSGWNYGRFGDPANPAFNHVREVDYCSGAAIAIAKTLFERIGGFDLRYAPAYYEDTDLAFQVREQGLRVLYQPASVVIHFEGITSGTDVGSGTKRFQVINQAKFLDRWADVLPRQPSSGTDIELAKEHRIRGRILVIDATTPEPDKDSGSVRLVNLLRSMLDLGLKPTFFAENRQFLSRYSESLQQMGVEVLWGPWLEPVEYLRKHGHRFQAIVVSRHYILGPLLSVIREYAPRARLIFDTVDLHYLREQRAATLAQKPELMRQVARTQLAELRLVRAADVTLVVSPVEQELLAREVPNARVEVLSNVHEVAGPGPSFETRRDLYFVGGFQHTPNVDAVQWFVQEVWPTIAAELPDVRFHIVGSRMPDVIKALANDRVIAHGFVPSMDPFLDGCRISVAPLRYGAGVKGKVNQSMAHGQPVVATSIGAEGMNLKHGVDVLIADDPATFARETVRLYRDPVLWQQLAVAGLANIERHFSMATARQKLERLLLS
ncbi:MAG: glycosyltransferase [Ahniella sp.]|nr:glycosyltransferase [Ahniella sp.]